MKTAYATIKGFEVMQALRRQQACKFQNIEIIIPDRSERSFIFTDDIHDEIQITECAFGLGNDVMTDMMNMLENHLKIAQIKEWIFYL